MSCSTSCLPFSCWCYIVAKLMLVASHRPPPHLFSLLLFYFSFTREIDTFIKGAAARTCVMVVVVVSLHECLVYYRNSVDRDAEKEKKNTRLLPISRPSVGGRLHNTGRKIKGSRVKTKNKNKNVRQTWKWKNHVFIMSLYPQTKSDDMSSRQQHARLHRIRWAGRGNSRVIRYVDLWLRH